MTRIIETPEWAAAVKLPEEQMYERNQAVQRLLQAATVADIKDLVRLCRQGSAGDIDTAITLLGSLAVSNDPRFRRADLVNWLKVIRKLARAAFPRRAHGQRAVAVLAKLDQAGCERILLATELRGLSQSEHSQVLLTLRGLGTPRAVQRLEQLAKGRSRVAKAATSELIRMRGLTGHQLAAVGARWRRERDYASLLMLEFWLSRMHGQHVRQVAKVLGPPSSEDDDIWTYVPQKPRSARTLALHLFLDEDGRVGYHKIK